MTYSTLVENVRQLTLPLQAKQIWDKGNVFQSINRAARRLSIVTKDDEASTTMTLTSGTATYTISSAIASDVDEILAIRIGNAWVDILSQVDFNNRTITDLTSDETTTDTTFENVAATIYNGTIQFDPSPDATYTATVWYSTKESILTVSSSNLSASVNLRDDYLNALEYLSASEMYLIDGNIPMADKLEAKAMELYSEARENQPMVEFKGQITYSDIIGVTNNNSSES